MVCGALYGKRLKTAPSLYNRQPDAPAQILSVVNELISLPTIPDIEVYDLRGPLGVVPDAANLTYLNPLLP